MADRVTTTTKDTNLNLTILPQSDVKFYRKSIPLCSGIGGRAFNPFNNNILLEDIIFNNNNYYHYGAAPFQLCARSMRRGLLPPFRWECVSAL